MITIEVVVSIHGILIKRYGGASGIGDRAALKSAVNRPYQTFGGEELYKTSVEKAAALIESTVKNHPFIDGNKRTGYAAMRILLRKDRKDIRATEEEKYEEAVHFSHRAKVTFVASRGNDGEEAERQYPAVLDDDWVLCGGGTGTDGQYILENVNSEFSASTGPQIDVAAPATNLLIRTTEKGGGYGPFNGTSAATPHVAGVAALLMSYLNDPFPSYNNLAPEDVEQILQMTAFDPDTPFNSLGIVGYDTLTGHGRLDAGAALQLVEKPYRSLLHFGTDAFAHSKSVALHASNQAITLLARYQDPSETWFQPDAYKVDVYEVTATVSHNLTANEVVMAAWPRSSSTTVLPLYDGSQNLKAYERATLESVNQSQAVLTGYLYKVYDLNGTPLGWWPFDTAQLHQAELTYSLLVCDTLVCDQMAPTSLSEEEPNPGFSLVPNPAQDQQAIHFTTQSVQPVAIHLLDLHGREIRTVYQGPSQVGKNSIVASLQGLPPGLYCYHIQLGPHTHFLKTLKP